VILETDKNTDENCSKWALLDMCWSAAEGSKETSGCEVKFSLARFRAGRFNKILRFGRNRVNGIFTKRTRRACDYRFLNNESQ